MNLRDELLHRMEQSERQSCTPDMSRHNISYPTEVRPEEVEITFELLKEYVRYALRFNDYQTEEFLYGDTERKFLHKYMKFDFPMIRCLKVGETLPKEARHGFVWPDVNNTGHGSIELIDCAHSGLKHWSDGPDELIPAWKDTIFNAGWCSPISEKCLKRLYCDRDTISGTFFRDRDKYQLVLTNIRDKELELLNRKFGEWLKENHIAKWEYTIVKHLFRPSESIRTLHFIEPNTFRLDDCGWALVMVLD